MASIQIEESMIGSLEGEVAVVTGGATGIGRAAAELLSRCGARVHVLDMKTPAEFSIPDMVEYHFCDVASWTNLSQVFLSIGPVHMTFVNAGVSETSPFIGDIEKDVSGEYKEPTSGVLDVNLKASLNTVKLAIHVMKRQSDGGRIVLTSSSTAYMPELSLPLYSSMKLALIGLVRSLRNTLQPYNISISAVAPASTYTPLIEGPFFRMIQESNIPYSSPEFVALALVYSVTASETSPVEVYGGKFGTDDAKPRRWNGRVILTLGDTYTELEGPLMELRPFWFGRNNTSMSMAQQAITMSL